MYCIKELEWSTEIYLSIYLSIVYGTSGTNSARFIQKQKESTISRLFLDKIFSKGCSQISLTYKRLDTTRRRITLNVFQSCSRHLGCFCTWGSVDFLRTIWLVTLAYFSQSETCLSYVISRGLIAGVFQFFSGLGFVYRVRSCVYNLLYSDVSRKTQVTLWILHELLIFWIEIPSAVSHFFAKCGDWTIEIERTGHVDWDSNDICGRWRFSGAEKSSWG